MSLESNPVDAVGKMANGAAPITLTSSAGMDGQEGMGATANDVSRRTSKFRRLFSPNSSAYDTYPTLAILYRELNGRKWYRRGGWLTYLSRGSIEELDAGCVYGVKSKSGNVELLMLQDNNLNGRIPLVLAKLTSLKSLNLANNKLKGSIPAELGCLLQLQSLQLQSNQIKDRVSPLLGSLLSLTRLSLADNLLTGPIPDSIGNLIHLEFLSLEHNRLSGNLPTSLCTLSKLETLNAAFNCLEGDLQSEVGDLEYLKKLDLGHNYLSGPLPAELGKLKRLTWLRLENNRFIGRIPEEFAQLRNLVILSLANNQLKGGIPRTIRRLPQLIAVNLRGNHLRGHIPADLNDAHNLWKLDLGENDLEGECPVLSNLNELKALWLDHNWLVGDLQHSYIGELTNLLQLHLQNNHLSGPVPEALGDLRKLVTLDISNNHFEGPLVDDLEGLECLQSLLASNNRLSGSLPDFLGSMTKLECIALDGNFLVGRIPASLGRLSALRRLYLECNDLEGHIPSELGQCTLLEEMYLFNNRLEGSIPERFQNLKELQYLYLYQNRLTGPVPEWLGEISTLKEIVLGDNKFTGHVPWQLGHLHQLQGLYLNDNVLEGSIPSRLVNCESLQVVFLQGNCLSGIVPRSLRHLRDLRELNLEANDLHGQVPLPIFLMPSLGPEAQGLRFHGNPRLIDSRGLFTKSLRGSICAPSSAVPTTKNQTPFAAAAYQETSSGKGTEYEENPKDGDNTSSIDDYESNRPWETSEEVMYFFIKTLLGYTNAATDYAVATRLYIEGCSVQAMMVLGWTVVSALVGIGITRQLGCTVIWQIFAAVRLALPLQAQLCFYHSCYSDLFQALEGIEGMYLATIQLVTQATIMFGDWGRWGGDGILGLSMCSSLLALAITTMHRLDNARLIRKEDTVRQAADLLRKDPPWYPISAWPRIVMIIYHACEGGVRCFTIAAALASLPFAVLALVPGLAIRWNAWRAVLPSNLMTPRHLLISLVHDSEFGPWSPTLAFMSALTTMESAALLAFAKLYKDTHTYPESVWDALISLCTIMLIYKWTTIAIERITLGLPSPKVEVPLASSPSSPISSPITAGGNTTMTRAIDGKNAQTVLPVEDEDIGEGKA